MPIASPVDELTRPKRVSERVRLALRDGRVVLGRSWDVEERDGVVHLRGRVGSYHAKQLAQELAKSAAEGCPVRNELDVVH